MKKSMGMIAGAAIAVPITLTACGDNTEEVQEDGAGENNEEDSESVIEDLAEEYDLDVTMEEGSGDAPEATQEELEEAFHLISSVIDVERLEFIESPQEGELEESGEAEGHYAVHDADGDLTDPVMQLRFEYEMEEDMEEEDRHPPFSDIMEGEAEFTGSELIEWEESHFEVESTGDRTVAEFYAEGEWILHAEYEGTEVSFEESSDWFAEFATNVLVGQEE